MNISVQKLLAKMEEELKQAQTAHKPERLREKMYSIKILCELILDEHQATSAAASTPPVTIPSAGMQQQVVQPQIFQQPASLAQAKKLALDEANGDSLFDF